MGSSETHRTPMSACLYVEMADGTASSLPAAKIGKPISIAEQGWYEPKYDDSAWQNAIAYVPPQTPMGTDALGNPWQTGPVKLLRHSFAINKPVTSARLYVTALGAYRFQINGVAHRRSNSVSWVG